MIPQFVTLGFNPYDAILFALLFFAFSFCVKLNLPCFSTGSFARVQLR